jgi:3-phosphoshikimate 1-carboxyvinyltransferase
MRFLTALVSLGCGHYRLDGDARMRQRPVEDLLAALRQLGVQASAENGDGCPPVVVDSKGLPGGRVTIRGDLSSQFLSGLLMVAPLATEEVTIELDGPLVSMSYVTMTTRLTRQFGARIESRAGPTFYVPGNQQYVPRDFTIEPDATSANYFFAAAAITGGTVTVDGLTAGSAQGDIRFVDVLQEMGCQVSRENTGITVKGRPLHGICVDMNDMSDCVMTLAAIACFAEGPTSIRHVGHIQHKESNRLQALATELSRIGARVQEHSDGLTISPSALHGATIETYNDHRMAMSMSLIGLRVPGIVIRDPGCVAKTYPGFFEDIERLRDRSAR